MRLMADATRRHTIYAAQVTPIGNRDAQIIYLPVIFIYELCHTVITKSTLLNISFADGLKTEFPLFTKIARSGLRYLRILLPSMIMPLAFLSRERVFLSPCFSP